MHKPRTKKTDHENKARIFFKICEVTWNPKKFGFLEPLKTNLLKDWACQVADLAEVKVRVSYQKLLKVWVLQLNCFSRAGNMSHEKKGLPNGCLFRGFVGDYRY